MIPFDPRKPMDPSGIRVGTPAITTRGCKEKDMQVVADLVDEALMHRADAAQLGKIKEKVREFSVAFPVPGVD